MQTVVIVQQLALDVVCGAFRSFPTVRDPFSGCLYLHESILGSFGGKFPCAVCLVRVGWGLWVAGLLYPWLCVAGPAHTIAKSDWLERVIPKPLTLYVVI